MDWLKNIPGVEIEITGEKPKLMYIIKFPYREFDFKYRIIHWRKVYCWAMERV